MGKGRRRHDEFFSNIIDSLNFLPLWDITWLLFLYMQYCDGHIAEQCWNQINETPKEETRYFCNGQDKAESVKPAMGMTGAETGSWNPMAPAI